MRIISTFLIFSIILACKPKTTKPRQLETKDGYVADSLENYSAPAKAIMVLNYQIDVELSSMAPCKGEVTLELMSNFSLNFPKGMSDNNLICFGLIPIPLGLILSGISGGIVPKTDKSSSGKRVSLLSKAKHDGMVLYLSDFISASFDPPRPVLLGPVVTDVNKYRGFQTRVKTIKKFDKQADEGVISVRVLSNEASYRSPIKAENNFDGLLVWEMKSEGFTSSALKGLTLPKITWYWQTSPIIIPHIAVELSSSDLISKRGIGGVLGGITDALIGQLKINLHVLDYSRM